MSDTLKIIVAFLFIAIFIIWCYTAYKKRVNEIEEMWDNYEANHKPTGCTDDILTEDVYKYRDITDGAEALLEDWERVGEYLRYAMKEMDKELADKDKENKR